MSKNIVYCSDGTWDGPKIPTNVYRLYSALDSSDTQLRYYDEGVGRTGTFLNRLWGGAFGSGLVENVREGYDRIACCYRPGDRIYLFGFSRGAYTARSLGGMIAYCGLPAAQYSWELVDTAFRAYRSRDGASKWMHRPAEFVDARIEMIGVWDTVGTLGIPGALFGRQDAAKYGFLDTALHADVRAGYHALSIDEKRRQFAPTLWDSKPADGQVVQQVWFAGVHGDVGGGLPETKLSDITLAWMLARAEQHGIELNAATRASYPKLRLRSVAATDRIDRSWRLFWGLPRVRPVPCDATIANSVAVRVATERSYRPKRLLDPETQELARTYPLEWVVDAEIVAPAA